MVELMISTGVIVPLDHGRIPNLSNIHKTFTNSSFDPGMKHSVPYMWGTQGFGYRKSKYPSAPTSWSAVFDDAVIGKHSGKIAMLSDNRAVIGGALKYLGHSLNTVDPKEIAAAADLILGEEALQNLRRGQWPGPAAVPGSRSDHGVEWRRGAGHGGG